MATISATVQSWKSAVGSASTTSPQAGYIEQTLMKEKQLDSMYVLTAILVTLSGNSQYSSKYIDKSLDRYMERAYNIILLSFQIFLIIKLIIKLKIVQSNTLNYEGYILKFCFWI